MARKNPEKLVLKLFFGAVAMFAFGFALIPLYDVFCDIAGINGKTSGSAYEAVAVEVDTSREITIQFLAENSDGMTWEFRPMETTMKVHPGQSMSTAFYVRNPTSRDMVSRSVPSVSPGRAAEFFLKTECFCFEEQPLAAGESVEMPMQFIVDQDLPQDIRTITLAYTIFDVTPKEQVSQVNP